VKRFLGIFLAFFFAQNFYLPTLRCQPEGDDSLTYYWHQAFFDEIRSDFGAAIIDFKRVHDLCETETLDITEWYRATSWLGIARAEAAFRDTIALRYALGRALANHFWNFELLRNVKVFDTLCGKLWVDSVYSYWSKIRENDMAFWHSQPSIILRPTNLESKKYPLLVVLHGGNDCYQRIVKRLALLPDKLQIVIAVPAGVHRMSDVINSWDDDTVAGEEKIGALIAELSKNQYVDSTNISLLGFSQGSQMSYEYSLDHSDQITNVFAFAGFAPAKNTTERIKKAAGHHLRYVAVSGSTDAADFLNSTRELQQNVQAVGIPFEMRIENSLPHGLPLNMTEYFEKLWKENQEQKASDQKQRNLLRTR